MLDLSDSASVPRIDHRHAPPEPVLAPPGLTDSAGAGAGRRRIVLADSLRGLAALWVVLYHMKEGRHIDALVQALPEYLVAAVFNAGHLGVAIFFVLSGLVIAGSGRHCGDSRRDADRFLLRRLVRLCPPYYFSLIVVVAFMWLKARQTGAATALPGAGDFVLHLLYLQDLAGVTPLNTIYWTLCIELQFYLVFVLLMLCIGVLQRFTLPHARLLVIGAACVIATLWPLALADDQAWGAKII